MHTNTPLQHHNMPLHTNLHPSKTHLFELTGRQPQCFYHFTPINQPKTFTLVKESSTPYIKETPLNKYRIIQGTKEVEAMY